MSVKREACDVHFSRRYAIEIAIAACIAMQKAQIAPMCSVELREVDTLVDG